MTLESAIEQFVVRRVTQQRLFVYLQPFTGMPG